VAVMADAAIREIAIAGSACQPRTSDVLRC
jgi:hypothetical protein